MPLLLLGPEGVGKKFSVLQAAKESFSKGDVNSSAIVQLNKGVHSDFHIVEPEPGKDIGVDLIREAVGKALEFPLQVPRRYVVIDGVDRMTVQASNALLKTLEEPPETTQFFLLASSQKKILPTIRSRCGVVRYNTLSSDFIVSTLAVYEADPLRSLLCARLSDGSLGYALHLATSGRLKLRDTAVDLLNVGVTGDLSRVFLIVDDLKDDLSLCIRFLHCIVYDLNMIPYSKDHVKNVDIVDDLTKLRDRLGHVRVESLRCGLKDADYWLESRVNTSFHVKTFLSSVFQG